MLFLLDTNAFSQLMLDMPSVTRRFHDLGVGHQAVICHVVRGEILFGLQVMPEGRRRRVLQGRAMHLFQMIPCIDLPESTGDAYADIKYAQQMRGRRLEDNDAWIAASARALHVTLVDRRPRFARH